MKSANLVLSLQPSISRFPWLTGILKLAHWEIFQCAFDGCALLTCALVCYFNNALSWSSRSRGTALQFARSRGLRSDGLRSRGGGTAGWRCERPVFRAFERAKGRVNHESSHAHWPAPPGRLCGEMAWCTFSRLSLPLSSLFNLRGQKGESSLFLWWFLLEMWARREKSMRLLSITFIDKVDNKQSREVKRNSRERIEISCRF